jgi:acylglycerol lipase
MPKGRAEILLTSTSSTSTELRGQPLPSTIRYQEGKFLNSRGQDLFYLAAFPKASDDSTTGKRTSSGVRAVVLFLHALGDHSRRYLFLYELLCELGFGVIAYDFVSHGASDSCSQGVRAHTNRFRDFVDDTNDFVTFAKSSILPQALQTSWASSTPIVVSAYSYGTLVGMHTVLSRQHHFAGMCYIGPSLWIRLTPMLRLQAALAGPLSTLFPKAHIVPAVKRHWLCRDPGYFEDFDNDPLTTNTQKVTARMGSETLRAMRALAIDPQVVRPNSAFSQIPTLFLIGSADRVVCQRKGSRFFDRLASRDKEVKVFHGLYHCLLEDPERDDVLRHLMQWLEQRFPKRE